MSISEIGDGSGYHDCIYVLLKEVVDNAVDEFMAAAGRKVDISVDYPNGAMNVRDYGRGIPIGKLVDCVVTMNTSGKYKKGAFKFFVGRNGVGGKAVNALLFSFEARSFHDGGIPVAFSPSAVYAARAVPDGIELLAERLDQEQLVDQNAVLEVAAVALRFQAHARQIGTISLLNRLFV